MIAACVALALAAPPPPLRLVDLLREARERNPDLKAAQAQLRATKEMVPVSGALDDPMLTVELWNAPVDFSTVPLMVELAQSIPLGGKRGARSDMARADATRAEADLAGIQREIETQVASSYYDLFLADRTQAANEELETILKVLLHSSEVRISSGRGEQVELLRAQASLVQLRGQQETATDRRKSAWARLASLVDRNPSEPPGPTSAPDAMLPLPDLDTLQRHALQSRPELASARARITSAEAQARFARAERIPDLNLFLAGMHEFQSQAPVSNFLFAGFRINLPLFGGGRSGPPVSSADAQVLSAQESEHALRNRVAAEVAEAHAHVIAERRQIDLHHQLLPIARQVVESAQNSYGAGRGDFATVLDSARELRMHELELATHLAAYVQRLAELQRAVGEELGVDESAETGHDQRH